MKLTRPSFTLVEAVITLCLVAALMLFGLHLNQRRSDMTLTHQQWEASFASQWQAVRAKAQASQTKQVVSFGAEAVNFGQQKLNYPKNFHREGVQEVEVLPTGYTAPGTVVLTNGQAQMKIIFSLGGGDYRVVW
ncbi:type II secretion protein [Lactobacillaceae bacterium L1_55_11]|nr:type II secretion protein [Lactobacillaceae bacterium L1_55_11]